jgi:hypothetical protein
LVPLILGVVGLAITVAYERRFAKYPFLEKSLFKDMSSIVTYVAAVAQGIVVGLYYPLFLGSCWLRMGFGEVKSHSYNLVPTHWHVIRVGLSGD